MNKLIVILIRALHNQTKIKQAIARLEQSAYDHSHFIGLLKAALKD